MRPLKCVVPCLNQVILQCAHKATMTRCDYLPRSHRLVAQQKRCDLRQDQKCATAVDAVAVLVTKSLAE